MHDVSQAFVPNIYDETVARALVKLDKTPEAILHFDKKKDGLTHYGYWYLLSTLWVSYSGYSDLQLWKMLFEADRPKRKISIMKPSEVQALERLPYEVTVYRAHRIGETDWISYTTEMKTAVRFAMERDVPTISEYKIKKRDVLAYFTRRNESEILMLDKDRADFQREYLIVDEGDKISAFAPEVIPGEYRE